MDCCNKGLTDTFTDRLSRRDADRYRKRGLPPRARKLLAALESTTSLQNKSTLEIGAGAGGFTIELLRRGAANAVAVDVVTTQLAAARELAGEYDVADQVEFVNADFALHASAIQPADIVVLDRVVCCYPDWQSLLSAAAVRAREVLIMTYPRDNALTRVEEKIFNAWQRLLRHDFRYHVHPVGEMKKLLNTYNFSPQMRGHHFLWEILVAVHR